MKRITYERVYNILTEKAHLQGNVDFIDVLNNHNHPNIDLIIQSIIDAINEQISWKGLTVINKTYICLPSETTPLIRHEFDAKTEFECVSDMDDQITILSNDGTYCSAKKEWFYIKD